MIVSASRRTDIPAHRADWLMDRVREGFCDVASPFDRRRVSRVSLEPEDVDAIVFWTRDAAPLLPCLDELDGRGFRYYFQYTVVDYPQAIEPGAPPLENSLETFQRLAERLEPARVVWRYDPILLTPALGPAFHADHFGRIAEALTGATEKAVISVYDEYPFTRTRLGGLESAGLAPAAEPGAAAVAALMEPIAAIARTRGLDLESCAERIDLRPFGIRPGRCVDPELIRRLFGIEVRSGKDRGQRPLCGCAPSRDIGAYDTCPRGCLYCYANRRPTP